MGMQGAYMLMPHDNVIHTILDQPLQAAADTYSTDLRKLGIDSICKLDVSEIRRV